MVDPAAAIPMLYERHAAAWAAVRDGSAPESGWLDRFLARVRPGGSVLDLGCGSGRPIAEYVLARGFNVTGVDTSRTLIGLCASRFPEQTWLEGDMVELALPRRFDGLLAWDSAFHLTRERQRALFRVLACHAAPGAALMFTSGPENNEAIGSWQGEPLYHASLDPGEYRDLLAEHGFTLVAHAREDPEYGHHTVWLARFDPAATPA